MGLLLLCSNFYLFKNKNAGFLRQPKWGHLRDLHQAIKLCEECIVNSDPTYMHLGNNLEVLFSEMFTFFDKFLSLRKGLWIDFYFLKTTLNVCIMFGTVLSDGALNSKV